MPILRNGEPAMMGATESEMMAGPPHPSFPFSPPPSRAYIPPPPPAQSQIYLPNGEPSIIGADETPTIDRSKHLSPTHELIHGTVVPPAPVSSPFTTQLDTVLNLFREGNFDELSRPDFPQRVTSILTFASEELNDDPETYNRDYRLGVRELAEYMAQNFQMDTRDYSFLL
jgi:hypothetical protein